MNNTNAVAVIIQAVSPPAILSCASASITAVAVPNKPIRENNLSCVPTHFLLYRTVTRGRINQRSPACWDAAQMSQVGKETSATLLSQLYNSHANLVHFSKKYLIFSSYKSKEYPLVLQSGARTVPEFYATVWQCLENKHLGKATGPSHSVAKTRRPGVWQNLRGRVGPGAGHFSGRK